LNLDQFYLRISSFFLGLTIISCATQQIVVETVGKSTVSLVEGTKLTEQGELVGPSPATIKLTDINGRVIKISAPGKLPQYLLITNVLGTETRAKLQLRNETPAAKDSSGGGPPAPASNQDKNLIFRTLLKAYQALSTDNYKSAIELSDKLKELAPEVAAPHIVKGITYLNMGQKSDALSEFNQAKAMDPSDLDIDKLIEAAN